MLAQLSCLLGLSCKAHSGEAPRPLCRALPSGALRTPGGSGAGLRVRPSPQHPAPCAEGRSVAQAPVGQARPRPGPGHLDPPSSSPGWAPGHGSSPALPAGAADPRSEVTLLRADLSSRKGGWPNCWQMLPFPATMWQPRTFLLWAGVRQHPQGSPPGGQGNPLHRPCSGRGDSWANRTRRQELPLPRPAPGPALQEQPFWYCTYLASSPEHWECCRTRSVTECSTRTLGVTPPTQIQSAPSAQRGPHGVRAASPRQV